MQYMVLMALVSNSKITYTPLRGKLTYLSLTCFIWSFIITWHAMAYMSLNLWQLVSSIFLKVFKTVSYVFFIPPFPPPGKLTYMSLTCFIWCFIITWYAMAYMSLYFWQLVYGIFLKVYKTVSYLLSFPLMPL